MNRIKVINAFDLKIIAFITMIIDHIGYFFYFLFSYETCTIFRVIGRMSMPLFAFLIFQGFIHTSDLYKYIKRLFRLSIITQLIIVIMGSVINYIVPEYDISFYYRLNVVFSFCLSLIFISLFDKLIRVFKDKRSFEILIYLLSMFGLVSLYYLLNIDYGISILLLILFFYVYYKFIVNKEKKIFKYIFLIICLVLFLFFSTDIAKFSLLSLFFIILYNGKKGNSVKKIFYYMYPLQFIILYISGAIIYVLK